MHVLVIGGSVFLGRAMVAEALAVGADVTVFHRGRSGPSPEGATHLAGDRTSADDLAQLSGRRFDLVIDTCGYVPAEVALAVDAVTADHYAFVSTVSTYPSWPERADYPAAGTYDGTPDATRADVPDDLDAAASYGWLKVGCERAVLRAFGAGRSSILRAGALAGPFDSAVGRLPWWIDRVARGGEVLAPGAPDDPVALIDARDLARFALARVAGTFECAGPPARDSRLRLLEACREATGSDATFTWVGDDFLGDKVAAWTELPLWIPHADAPGTFASHSAPAAAAGLSWRPLADTVADTWEWQRSFDWQPSTNTPGLAPDREADLLAKWHATT